MISVGYRNYIAANRVVAIISPDSRPSKNMINGAREQGKIIDATMGKKTKSVVVTNSNHIVLSANSPDTLVHRIQSLENSMNFSGVEESK